MLEFTLLHLTGDLDGFGLVAGEQLGGIAGIADLDAELGQPSCLVQGVCCQAIRMTDKVQEGPDVVSLGELDLIEGQ